jgi:hypothetical protein
MQGSRGLTKPGVKPTRIEDRPISTKATAVPKWKAESEAFRAQLRNARMVTDAVRSPSRSPPRGFVPASQFTGQSERSPSTETL